LRIFLYGLKPVPFTLRPVPFNEDRRESRIGPVFPDRI
jgi:hypothetical protein